MPIWGWPLEARNIACCFLLSCDLLEVAHIYTYRYFSAQQQSLHPSSKPTSCTCASCNSHDGCQGPADNTVRRALKGPITETVAAQRAARCFNLHQVAFSSCI